MLGRGSGGVGEDAGIEGEGVGGVNEDADGRGTTGVGFRHNDGNATQIGRLGRGTEGMTEVIAVGVDADADGIIEAGAETLDRGAGDKDADPLADGLGDGLSGNTNGSSEGVAAKRIAAYARARAVPMPAAALVSPGEGRVRGLGCHLHLSEAGRARPF